MSNFKYTDGEKEINKVIKYNQELSQQISDDKEALNARNEADSLISSSEELLKSLGYGSELASAKEKAIDVAQNAKLEHRPQTISWEELLAQAEEHIPCEVSIEDFLTAEEIENVTKELDEINTEFSRKTSIVNKTDLTFLAVATALQVAKSLIFPYIAEKFDYGKSFDPEKRKVHNDKSIEDAHKKANDEFKNKHLEKNKKGYWINILYQTPPYDITKGSTDLGMNMGGKYHRLYTLGHDPVLGWIFGTANILTDVITFNNFMSYRVDRKPTMRITKQPVGMGTMFYESYEMAKADRLNLPAAIFAQAQHLKSDVNTKTGLPIPILEVINENFASKLYKNQYDALCLARDIKIIGASYAVSMIFDIVISLVHGLFRKKDEPKDLYEVRTRKILLISNAIASTSSIIFACVTENPKNLDIGSLLSTVSHLFTDVRFIAKVKKEFIQKEMDKKLQAELDKIDELYNNI